MTLVEKLSDVRDFRKILETTVKEIGENYSADVCQIVLSNPLDGNFTSICEYIANPEEIADDLSSITFPVQPEGGGLGWLSLSRQSNLTREEIDEIRIALANIADILRYAQINDIVQRDTFRSAFMSEITNLMSLPMGLGDALFMVVNILGKALAVSRCIFVCVEDSDRIHLSEWRSYEYWQRERIEAAQDYGWPTKDSAVVAQTLLSAVPIMAFEGQQNSYKTPVQDEMEFIGVRSQLSVAMRSSIGVHGTIILQQCESRHAWTRDEIDMVQNVADTVAEALAQLDDEKKNAESIMQLHQRDVAETKAPGQKSLQEVRQALKGVLGKTTIKKAQKSKAPESVGTKPLSSERYAVEQSAFNFQPQSDKQIAESEQQSRQVEYPFQQNNQRHEYEQGADEGHFESFVQKNAEWPPETSSEQASLPEQFSSTEIWTDSESGLSAGLEAPPEPNYETLPETSSQNEHETAAQLNRNPELLGPANISEKQASQVEPNQGAAFKGLLSGLLGNQRVVSSNAASWDIEISSEETSLPSASAAASLPFQASSSAPDILPALPSHTHPGEGMPPPDDKGTKQQQSSKWGDLDAIPTPGANKPTQTASGTAAIAHPSGKAAIESPAAITRAELDHNAAAGQQESPSIPRPVLRPVLRPAVPPPEQAAATSSSKWGNLDSISGPSAAGAHPGITPPAVTPNAENERGKLDSIPTPVSAGKSGLSAMMMGKAKTAATTGGSGLGQSLYRGGVKPPVSPSFIEGPALDIDEAAEAAKLKQILATSTPTSDFIFATEGIDMRLLGRIDSWVSQIESKDKHENGHVRSVAEYSTAVARLLGLSPNEVNRVRLAAIIHDVGKLGLPKLILQKPDEDLSDAELVMSMNHTIDGAKLIEGLPELAGLAPIVLAHHEEYDGNGYPEGLAGEDIPLAARIIHACNAYTELVANLVYRAGMPPEQAQNIMIRGAGSTYDPDVVTALIACISQGLVPSRII